MKYKKSKYPATLLMAAVLACQPIAAQAVTFADMNQVPWAGAETSIQKAADLGLVVGETINGKNYFRPKDSVSLCESAQLAFKVLQQTGKASANSATTEKWATVLNTYKIPTWVHPALSYCLDNGIVSITELSGYMKNGGTMPATREQAAKILGSALTVGNSSYKATATTTTFADNASISAEARPYVAVLKEAGVVNGDTDGKFNPKSTLNRTETAVMVSNLYSVLKNSSSSTTTTPSTNTDTNTNTNTTATSTKTGTVAMLTNFYVNFENSNAYYLFTSTSIPVTLNGDTSSITKVADLFKAGTKMQATVTLNSDSRAVKLAITADSLKSDSTDEDKTTTTNKKTKGELTKVTYDSDDNDGSITIAKTSTYKIDDADDVKITIDNKSYTLKKLKTLLEECKDDDKTIEVKVTLNSKDELTKIEGSIESDDDDDDYDATGKLKKITSSKITVGSKDYKVDDPDWVTVKLDGRSKDYDDLKEAFNDLDDDEYLKVSITLDKDDYVTEIKATTLDDDDDDDEEEVEGEIKDLDDDEIKIKSTKYDLAKKVEVDVDNGDHDIDDIDDLIEAFDSEAFTFEVTATVINDEVTKIEGKVTKVKGMLADYDEDGIEVETDWKDVTYDFGKNFDDDDYDDFDEDVEKADDKGYDYDEIEVTLKLKDGKINSVSIDY